MMLGQAAGAAAVIAGNKIQPVQDIDVSQLVECLRKRNVVLGPEW